MPSKKKALGKGLSALLASNETELATASVEAVGASRSNFDKIAISKIQANPYQPRTNFEKEALEELADSSKIHGIIQPITVKKAEAGNFILISGERRLRASQIAGLTEITAYVREANDQQMLEMALLENIQRENLDAIEIAISYQRLLDEIDLTQDQLAERVAKKRSTVTNYLRLLKLPGAIQLAIRNKQVSMGHARALINLPSSKEQKKIFNRVLKNNLSVRQTEQLVKDFKEGEKTKDPNLKPDLSFEEKKHQDELVSILDTKVAIKKTALGKGKIEIQFNSESDLSRILNIINQ